jgi:hypothetical protein
VRERCIEVGVGLVGFADNLYWEHQSLWVNAPAASGRRWQCRTPAMTAVCRTTAGEHVLFGGAAVAVALEGVVPLTASPAHGPPFALRFA